MAGPRLKDLCATRELKLGHYLSEFATPGIGHILKQAGAEFVFLDMEHSGFGYETVNQVMRYCEAADLAVFLRVPSDANHHIARGLDMGARGLILPMIGSAEQASRIVHSMRYPPAGRRGAAFGMAHDDYRLDNLTARPAELNEEVGFVAIIETVAGVEHVDAIAATEGVDCLWLGHFDLTNSMGIPGQFDHPDYAAAVQKLLAAGKRHGKGLGCIINSVEAGVRAHEAGYDFVCYSADVWLLQTALRAGIDGIRAGVAGKG
ncbi:HpcH/HpaI aldolase family protein [Marinivivus vitaminiproducens]|uniref:HpcH/HpaI aldolase family protein n=1 Tax=Marinivivus vitaminiproducens TaxID=3035935 RepID=UPI0027A1C164|nr:aldolase/citrate lyase family protein [Geminicoccaceae bacterium SCSIO 64248]